MAKNFGGINTDRVYNAIADATADDTQQTQGVLNAQEVQKKHKDRKKYTDAEALEFMQSFKTAGHKGVKLPRINLAFAPENYEYIKTMAQVRGQSYTEFVNHVLHQSMIDNADIYKKAIEFKNSI